LLFEGENFFRKLTLPLVRGGYVKRGARRAPDGGYSWNPYYSNKALTDGGPDGHPAGLEE
jgi:hypothetical protein